MDNNLKTPNELFNIFLVDIHKAAYEKMYTETDAIMVRELLDAGFEYTRSWLKDSEFYLTFKGNMVGYYLGLCVNCLGGGLEYADAWADGGDRMSKIKYDEIYDGGVWNNIFVLLEMDNPDERKDFQNFIIEMYEKWVVLIKDYLKTDKANEYIIYTVTAFFQLGVTLRLDILGY